MLDAEGIREYKKTSVDFKCDGKVITGIIREGKIERILNMAPVTTEIKKGCGQSDFLTYYLSLPKNFWKILLDRNCIEGAKDASNTIVIADTAEATDLQKIALILDRAADEGRDTVLQETRKRIQEIVAMCTDVYDANDLLTDFVGRAREAAKEEKKRKEEEQKQMTLPRTQEEMTAIINRMLNDPGSTETISAKEAHKFQNTILEAAFSQHKQKIHEEKLAKIRSDEQLSSVDALLNEFDTNTKIALEQVFDRAGPMSFAEQTDFLNTCSIERCDWTRFRDGVHGAPEEVVDILRPCRTVFFTHVQTF